MKDPFVSVIVATYNREECLCRTLQALFTQEYLCYEIIVVDQSKSHSSETLHFFQSNKNRFAYYLLDRPSLTSARNFGITKARGEIIIFCDDDALPTADFIKYHTINYGNPHLGAVAGKIKLIKDVKRPFTIFRSNLTGGKIVLSGRYIYNWESNEKVYTFSACGANMSFRKSLFERVGRFDTRFSIAPEYYEDVDFCYRLRKLGFKIIFEPNAMVLHQLYPTGGCRTEDNIKNEHSRFKNAILFYLKNMNKLFLPYMLLVFFLIAIKKILLPTRSLKDFVYVLSGLWCGFKTYNIAMPGID